MAISRTFKPRLNGKLKFLQNEISLAVFLKSWFLPLIRMMNKELDVLDAVKTTRLTEESHTFCVFTPVYVTVVAFYLFADDAPVFQVSTCFANVGLSSLI